MQRGWIFTRHYNSANRNFAWKRESQVKETDGNSKNSLVPVPSKEEQLTTTSWFRSVPLWIEREFSIISLYAISFSSNRKFMFINDFLTRRRACRKFPLLEQYFFYLIGIILLKPYFVEVVSIYGAVNNYRFKHIFRIISSIFPRNHWSCLNMLNKIVFVNWTL